MDRSLLRAVLAMDSYYGGQNVGSAEKLYSKSGAYGFKAIAYSIGGETVIAFAGTEDLSDAWYGWGTGLGVGSTQAGLAADFFWNVSGNVSVPYSSNVTFVGHSLGGGLAGLLGGLYGKVAVVFDNMAYNDAIAKTYYDATHVYFDDVFDPTTGLPIKDQSHQDVRDTFYHDATPLRPSASGISGWQLSGQILQGIQSTGTIVGEGIDLGISAVDRHKISLLVLMMYEAQEVASKAWHAISAAFGRVLVSMDLKDIGYSVVDEGAMPSGNVAAKAMFDDANDIATLFDSSSKSLVLEVQYTDSPSEKTFQTSLSSIVVQQADHLAKAHAMADGIVENGVAGRMGEGVVAVSVEGSSQAWLGAGNIVGFDDLKNNVRELLSVSKTVLDAGAETILDQVDVVAFGDGASAKADSLIEIFDDGYHLGNAAEAAVLFIGTTGRDVVTGTANNDMLITGAGNDTLVGGDGADALYGGDGSDVLVLGNINGVNATATSAPEMVDGGTGNDYIIVTGAKGSTVTVGKGDAGDRLLIHSSLLGVESSGDGKIGLFNLLGGVYLASPGMEAPVPRAMNADCNKFEDAAGNYYRAYYYTEYEEIGFFSGTTYSVYSLYRGPAIEYRFYEDEHRLEIRILGEDDIKPFPRDIFEPDDGKLPLLQTITISNFADGDYGIHLPPVFLPFGDVPVSVYYEDNREIYEATRKLDVVAAYDKAVHAISDNALAYSLDSDGTFHASTMNVMSIEAASPPEITAENLVMAIDGGAKADVLHGNDLPEHISGHGGDDVIAGGGGADVLDGGDGVDTLDYSSSKLGVVVNLALGLASGGDAEGDAIFNFESIIGSAGADRLIGDAGANVLAGGAGADLLNGGGGVDTADYSASSAGVTVNLATGTGFGGDAQGDTLAAIENVMGSAFNDTLTGNAGNNTLAGGAGADVLDGGDGFDTLDYSASNLGVTINLTSGFASGGDATGDLIFNFELIIGSAAADRLTGDAGANVITGGAGNDMLQGFAGDDTLQGGDGNDRLYGGAGADSLAGGDGVDTVDYRYATGGVTVSLVTGAGGGNDAQGDTLTGIENLCGSSFGDILTGDANVNRLTGLDGNDILNGGGGNDILVGGAGADLLIGGEGDRDAASYQEAREGVSVNLALGGSGGEAAGDVYVDVEFVYGSDFNDQITGDGAINRLTGGSGDDRLNGAAGNDYLLGEAGNDTLTGGLGEDVFVFDKSFGHDTIEDFWAGQGRTDRVWITGTDIHNFDAMLAHSTNTADGVVLAINESDSITFKGLGLWYFYAEDFIFA